MYNFYASLVNLNSTMHLLHNNSGSFKRFSPYWVFMGKIWADYFCGCINLLFVNVLYVKLSAPQCQKIEPFFRRFEAFVLVE